MEHQKLHISLELVEITLTVFLIGLLVYFHVEERQQHKDMMAANNPDKGTSTKK